MRPKPGASRSEDPSSLASGTNMYLRFKGV